jgi:hypothetical protein
MVAEHLFKGHPNAGKKFVEELRATTEPVKKGGS